MKLTPPLLPTPDDYDYDCSFFYSLFQDMRDPVVSKRRRRDDKEEEKSTDGDDSVPNSEFKLKKKNLKEIVASLLLLDEQETAEKLDSVSASEEEKSILEANHKRNRQMMMDSNSKSHHYYKNMDESEVGHVKKARGAAVAAAVAAMSGEEKGSSGSGSGTGTGTGATTTQRRLWVKDRSKAWWDQCSHPDFPESEFKRAFRMGKATFDMICEELNSVVAKEDTMLRAAIPVRQRVAVCIWRLATGEPLRLVSKRFGLGISTCHKLVLEVCSAIKTVLMPKFLQWPDEESVERTKKDFESSSGIPNVVGSMYTTHIPIIAPKVSVAAYFNKRHTERNQKTSYSITVQGVVNPKGVFTDVCIGWPGSMPDDQVLEKSALYQRANGGLLNGVWIVGSSGYPLMDWVLVPYTQQQLTWTQHAFNEKIREIQWVAKDAFARLKGRWSCLQKRTEVKLQDLPVVLGACCVLHNICEMMNEEMDPELNFELVDDEMVPENSVRSLRSVQLRDNIAHNLLHHGLAGTAFL
ncbi:hypothetical protein Scep_007866 [Stephania cephalantha]|uniref:DDE Tnp4 domain-containing protein n=1 Tax=Stephania cephalantha TaxID=152367 RepID=A0AAP0PNM7_9MAGN